MGKHCSVGIEMARMTITIAIMTMMIHVNNKNTNNHTDKMNDDNLLMGKFSCSFNVLEYRC